MARGNDIVCVAMLATVIFPECNFSLACGGGHFPGSSQSISFNKFVFLSGELPLIVINSKSRIIRYFFINCVACFNVLNSVKKSVGMRDDECVFMFASARCSRCPFPFVEAHGARTTDISIFYSFSVIIVLF